MFAQKGSLKTVTVDTINGAETVNFALERITGNYDASIVTLCTQVGGTSDGSLILQGSIDGTTYETLTETTGLIHFWPNDTLTIVDGAEWAIMLISTPFRYYREQGAGTSGDSTLITIKYTLKPH